MDKSFPSHFNIILVPGMHIYVEIIEEHAGLMQVPEAVRKMPKP